jgi:predicted phage terminase large subunit-like protein
MLRLLKGSWYAEVEGSTLVTEDLFEIVDHPPIEPMARLRAWDLASSVPNEKNNHKCDWTAGVLMSRDGFGNYYIEDVKYFQKQIDGVLTEIKNTAWEDGLDVIQILPTDPGQAGKVANKFYISKLAEFGVSCRSEAINPHSGKATRFQPFASIVHNGNVKIVKGEWNRRFLDDVCSFTGERGGSDDIADATATAFNQICKRVQIPSFHIPNLTQASPVPTI